MSSALGFSPITTRFPYFACEKPLRASAKRQCTRWSAHPSIDYCTSNPTTSSSLVFARRDALLAWSLMLALPAAAAENSPSLASGASVDALAASARAAYAERDFASAVEGLNELLRRFPKDVTYLEMRGTALVDGKNFVDALRDFDQCLIVLKDRGTPLDRARILSEKGLALEGLSDFVAALDTYKEALDLAAELGADADPFVLNSCGNCYASLGEWSKARDYFLLASRGFQTARREGVAGSLQQRLDGAVFSSSNAALMLAQLGDTAGAMKEMQRVARRAPGSADMRIGLAALYWDQGLEVEAESEYEFACNKITVGCSKYSDEDWLRRVRRWPPVMIERLQAFLALRSSGREATATRRREEAASRRDFSLFKE